MCLEFLQVGCLTVFDENKETVGTIRMDEDESPILFYFVLDPRYPCSKVTGNMYRSIGDKLNKLNQAEEEIYILHSGDMA